MRFGCVLSGSAPEDYGALRETAQAFDETGFDFVTTNGHILSAKADRYRDRPSPVYSAAFRDPFVLFSYVAAVTKHLKFRTAILISPLFPTALLAKQAAELSLCSNDRFELGVGISWQEAEYAAMGQDVHARGKRFEEQLEVLRLLWSEPFVTFEGEFHSFDEIGIGELPKSPIPIWIGCGDAEARLRRVAHYGDGWIPVGGLNADQPATRLRELVAEEGRAPAEVGISGRVIATPGASDDWIGEAEVQKERGATAIVIALGPDIPPTEQIESLIAAKRTLDVALKDS